MLLSTPYYRTLSSSNTLNTDVGEFTYTPYNVFCLETRLSPVIKKVIGSNPDIVFKTVHENNRMSLKIEIIDFDQSVQEESDNQSLQEKIQEKIQDEINKIVTKDINYCLISLDNLYDGAERRYPIGWFKNVVSSLDLPSEYKSFVRPEGFYLDLTNSDLGPNNTEVSKPELNYKETYNKLVMSLVTTTEQYWKDGVVFQPKTLISIPWKLESLDGKSGNKLYRPTWKDKRFAPSLVEFLLDKIRGDPYIKIGISDNLTRRHEIAKTLNQAGIHAIFEGSNVKVNVDGLDEAQYITSLVKAAESKGNGKTATYAVNSSGLLQDYIAAAQVLLGQSENQSPEILAGSLPLENTNVDVTGYQVSDPEKPYMFSCKVRMNISIRSFINALRDKQTVKK